MLIVEELWSPMYYVYTSCSMHVNCINIVAINGERQPRASHAHPVCQHLQNKNFKAQTLTAVYPFSTVPEILQTTYMESVWKK